MIDALATVAVALALLYAVLTTINLLVFRPPAAAPAGARPRISLLIPARDEARNIDAALAHALASEGVELEVVVLDDGSTDGTAARVRAWEEADRRVRLIHGPPLPSGWNGKQHACWTLSRAARNEILAFQDADVRLAPDALARLAAHLDRRRLDLLSGFPREVTGSLAEALVIPQIHVLLLGYLPLPFARLFRARGFAAGCGQLMMLRREAYEAMGGHSAIRASRHDGVTLPRTARAAGLRTDFVDAAPLASCRMYEGAEQVWQGFAKNATEGMATPIALPIWTVLLGGGHVLPFVLLPTAVVAGEGDALRLSAIAVALVWGARASLAAKVGQSALSVLLHPIGIALVLAIQWSALAAARRGRPQSWRGRSYDV